MGDELFEGPTTIGQLLDERRGKALTDIAQLPSDLLRSRDPDDLEADVLERWRVNQLVLDWDARTSEASEVIFPAGTDHGEVTGTNVTLYVPFSGAAGLFHIRPSSESENLPHGTVRGGDSLLLDYAYASADPATVKRELDHQVAAVKDCVSSINSDVDAFNADLSGLIHGALQADADVLAALGAPPRRQHRSSSVATAPNRSGLAETNRPADNERHRTLGRSALSKPKDFAPHTPRRPGRPKGPDFLQTAAEIVTAYQKRWPRDGPRPHWSEVARELGVDERTLRRARRHFGVDEAAIDRRDE